MSEKFKVEIRGTRPLLMNSPANILENQTTKRSREDITHKEEAEKVLYKDKDNKPIVPALNILTCLRDSAVNFKVPGRGKKTFKNFIFAGLRIEPEQISIISSNGWNVDIRTVVINRGRVPKIRPRFDEWNLEFQIEILDPIITATNLKQILVDAGKFNGLLDFRPLFGLFEVIKFEKVKSE